MPDDNELRVRFALPLPPSINQQYATVQGLRVLSRDSRRYREEAGQAICRLRDEGAISGAFVEALRRGFVGLFLDSYFERLGCRDLDGGLKITQDAVCQRQPCGRGSPRQPDRRPLGPHIEVEVEVIETWDFDAEYVYLG